MGFPIRMPVTSVAVVNAYRQFSGSTVAAKCYLASLTDCGYKTSWYQCVDSKNLSDYPSGGTIVHGLTTPFLSLNLAVNRTYYFARRLRGLNEDLILAADQVLATLTDHHKNCLVLVHDLREMNRATRTHLPAHLLYRYLLPKLSQAQGLLAISEASKQVIEARLKDAPPIRVVHHGTLIRGNPASHLVRSLSRLQDQKQLNVVYVAVDRPYKRIDFFLDLAREMERITPSIGVRFHFQLISKITATTEERLRRSPIKSLNVCPEVSDMTEVWNTADILAFTSVMEGFGRPLVEAMQFGIPVIASDMEPMKEVVGDGGTLLRPLALRTWTEALQRLTDPDRYAEAARRSSMRGAWFSPREFSQRLIRTLHYFGY